MSNHYNAWFMRSREQFLRENPLVVKLDIPTDSIPVRGGDPYRQRSTVDLDIRQSNSPSWRPRMLGGQLLEIVPFGERGRAETARSHKIRAYWLETSPPSVDPIYANHGPFAFSPDESRLNTAYHRNLRVRRPNDPLLETKTRPLATAYHRSQPAIAAPPSAVSQLETDYHRNQREMGLPYDVAPSYEITTTPPARCHRYECELARLRPTFAGERIELFVATQPPQHQTRITKNGDSVHITIESLSVTQEPDSSTWVSLFGFQHQSEWRFWRQTVCATSDSKARVSLLERLT